MFYTADLKSSNAKIDNMLLKLGGDMVFLLPGGSFRFVPDVGKSKC
jgi:hypothetical protein